MSKRVLISTCEDDIYRGVELIVGSHLETRGGVKFTRAKQRDECERLACSGNFDLIVLLGQTTLYSRGFVGSPLDNSVAIIQAIRAKVATPIIALSTMPEMEQLLSAGADVFLAMPYELKDLGSAVDRCLKRNAKEGAEADAILEPPPPIVEVSQPASPPGPVVRLRRKLDPQNPAPVRIVIVDAEEVLADMMRMLILSKYAVDLKVFTSSRAAWQELEQGDPDLLITDCIMPEMSGEQIVRGLMARKVSYPILVVSGYLSSDVVLGWFPDAPNIAFLQKPFMVEQFVSEVQKHFEPVSAGK